MQVGSRQLLRDVIKSSRHWVFDKEEIDYTLGKIFKNKWLPLYTMISFRDDIPMQRQLR